MATDGEGKKKRKKKRPTEEEYEEKIEYVVSLLSRRLLRGQVKAEYRKKYGPTYFRTIDEYIARAQNIIASRAEKGAEGHRCDALSVYENIVRTGTYDQVIRAQERIDALLGLATNLEAEAMRAQLLLIQERLSHAISQVPIAPEPLDRRTAITLIDNEPARQNRSNEEAFGGESPTPDGVGDAAPAPPLPPTV
jgi:hypothetical protein